MFTQLINLYTFYLYILKSGDVWKIWMIKETEINDCFFQHSSKVYDKISGGFYLNEV